jgi:uncharacterized protein YukE
VATAAAFMIMQPWAFYVAAALGTMISDPDGMAESAKGWRTADKDGLTAELDEVNEQVNALKTYLQEEGKWEGEAFSAFNEIQTSYTNSITQLKEIRNNTGDALDQTATFYTYATYFCAAVAGAMMGIALAKRAAQTNPVTLLPAEAASAAAGQAITKSVQSVIGKQLMVAGGLAFLLYQAKEMTHMSGKLFPTLDAIPSEMSVTADGSLLPFTNDGMTYQEGAGLTPTGDYSTTDSSTTDPTGGGGGGAADFK